MMEEDFNPQMLNGFVDRNINEIPQWSPWPKRLLDLDSFSVVERNTDKIEEEYNNDKYLRSERALEKHGADVDPMVLRLAIADHPPEHETLGWLEGRVVSGSADLFLRQQLNYLSEWLRPAMSEAEIVIELGCGMGANLWHLAKDFPDKTYLGADWSSRAVSVGNKIAEKQGSNIRLSTFDFYAVEYELLKQLDRPAIVFTVQALEQLPSAKSFVSAVVRDSRLVSNVFHVEPSYEVEDSSLLGLMRRRYLEMNDYNRDLLSLLQETQDVTLERFRPLAFGFNPFNVLSLYHWRVS